MYKQLLVTIDAYMQLVWRALKYTYDLYVAIWTGHLRFITAAPARSS